jgi:hypothetical protein
MRILLTAALLALSALSADAETALRGGSYEVVVRLDLPHIESRGAKTAVICVGEIAAGKAAAFPVLSDNNPLARCPAKNLRRDGDAILFEIVCDGVNSGKAYALYDLAGDRFQGSIAMTMGGKNMTMTEIQRGRRVGDCAPAPR